MEKKNMITILYTVVASIALLLCLILFKEEPSKRNKIIYNIKEEIEATKVNNKNNNKIDWKKENIVFLGDSITEIYPIKEIYGDLPIVKSGVSGYTTSDILKRMYEMVYRYNPTKVFILIGTNDFIYNGEDTKEKTVNNIKSIIEEIVKEKKKVKIYLESIYPVNHYLNPIMVINRKNDTIREMNNMMEEYCKSKDITYIDMYKELVDNNDNFNEKYTDDGLHPNILGYAKISQVRLTYLYGIKE